MNKDQNSRHELFYQIWLIGLFSWVVVSLLKDLFRLQIPEFVMDATRVLVSIGLISGLFSIYYRKRFGGNKKK